jgi:large subunit ribosomal protein L15
MLKLGEIRNARGAHKNTKRLGRGSGTGRGGTAGKGHKGQLARSGGQSRIGFEGGQMPLYRRVPKRGFTNVFRTQYAIINLCDLADFSGNEVSLESLKKSGLVKTSLGKLKILGTGDFAKPMTFKVNAVTKTAREKIEKAGGKVELLS